MSNPSTQTRTALFISHATPEDNHFVRWLGAKLSAMGYEVWADVMRLRGGDDWARRLESALNNRAAKMLLVATPGGMEKQGVRNEIEIATGIAKEIGDDNFIIPLRLAPYKASFRSAHIQYIDFVSSWAKGLAELTALLDEMGVAKKTPGPLEDWLDGHSQGAAKLVKVSEPLLSNWLDVTGLPSKLYYIEPPTGFPLDRFQARFGHKWPLVPFQGGVVSFATPDASGFLGEALPGKEMGSCAVSDFLDFGWAPLGIKDYQARAMCADLVAQAFDKFFASRSLKAYEGANKRLSWWGDIKTVPTNQIRFNWGHRHGARQIIGTSPKRGVHWHYAVNTQFKTAPIRHIRVAARLVFSENGQDAIVDPARVHQLRRSVAKSWRNPKWRDMLCAFLWWLSDGKSVLTVPVSDAESIGITVPPMPFGCPVSIEESDGPVEEESDDLDSQDDEWDEEESSEEEEALDD